MKAWGVLAAILVGCAPPPVAVPPAEPPPSEPPPAVDLEPIERSFRTVVVDAGLAVPSEAAQALEAGADAVLINTGIAQAEDPAAMGEAFRLGVEAGRRAYLAGRIHKKSVPTASSPTTGVAHSS